MLHTLRCPHCLSEHIEDYSFYETKNNGTRKLYRCSECQQVFAETPSSTDNLISICFLLNREQKIPLHRGGQTGFGRDLDIERLQERALRVGEVADASQGLAVG